MPAHKTPEQTKALRISNTLEREVEELEHSVNKLSNISKDEIINVLTEANDLIFRISNKT